MEFKNLLKDTDCACLENAIQDNITVFARKINKPTPLDKDFKTHWERDKRPEHTDQCKEVCGYKGISVNEWNGESERMIIEKFLTTFKIAPNHKDCILLFKFLDESGLIKHTPNQNDKTHYDFYKSDDFGLQMIHNQQIIPLNSFLKNE